MPASRRCEMERFEGKYIPEPNSGCWLWIGSLLPKGYGCFSTSKGNNERAHRFAWRNLKGPIPEGMFVCHKCDTPSCVNPDHLFLGTHQDNMRDRNRKNRHILGPVPDHKLKWKAEILREMLDKRIAGASIQEIESIYQIKEAMVFYCLKVAKKKFNQGERNVEES